MEDKIIAAFEIAVNNAARLPWQAFMVFAAACGFVFGLFMLVNPVSAIRFQQRFYAKINWRMEPISLEKEIRNTRLMGAFLIIGLLLILFFVASLPKAFL